jgi:hypothetical protein
MSTPLPVPDFRFRRLRRTANLRGMVRETRLSATDLILPIFVEEGISAPVPIASMPGVMRHTEAGLGDAVARAGCVEVRRESLGVGLGGPRSADCGQRDHATFGGDWLTNLPISPSTTTAQLSATSTWSSVVT